MSAGAWLDGWVVVVCVCWCECICVGECVCVWVGGCLSERASE